MQRLIACIAVCAATVMAQDIDEPGSNPLVARQQDPADASFLLNGRQG